MTVNIARFSITVLMFLFLFTPCVWAASPSGGREGQIIMKSAGENANDYFVVEGKPGETKKVTVELRNMSEEYPASAQLFVSDAVISQGGGMGTVAPGHASYDHVGGWFENKEIQTVQLKPAETRNYRFSFRIPEDSGPGDHVGMIVLYKFLPSSAEEENGQKQAQIIIDKAYSQSIAVHVKVPGPAESRLQLEALEPLWNGTDLFMNLRIANTGNRIEKSEGSIEVFAEDGKPVFAAKGSMGSIYPQTSGTYAFAVPEQMKLAGEYKASVKWSYGNRTIEKTFDFSVTDREVKKSELVQLATARPDKTFSPDAIVLSPMQLVLYVTAAVVFLVLILLSLLLLYRKRSNRGKEIPF